MAVSNFGQYMEKYHPQRWKRWVHLMINHGYLAERPCGCAGEEKDHEGHSVRDSGAPGCPVGTG